MSLIKSGAIGVVLLVLITVVNYVATAINLSSNPPLVVWILQAIALGYGAMYTPGYIGKFFQK